MKAPSIDGWIEEVRSAGGSERVGMMLVHRGVVRGTTRAGEPVSSMELAVDRARLEEVLAEARASEGIFEIRAWVNEGLLGVGDDIMSVLVAGDIREHVFETLQQLVRSIKTQVVSENELP